MILYKYKSITPQSGENALIDNDNMKRAGTLTTDRQSEKDRNRIAQILVENKIYYSNVKQLNDPFECRLKLQIPEDVHGRRELAVASLTNSTLSPKEKRKEIARLTSKLKDNPELAEKFYTDNLAKFSETFGFHCLSKKNNSPVMWAHYGGNLKGLCIGFKCSEVLTQEEDAFDEDFGRGLPVKYKTDLPVVEMPLVKPGMKDQVDATIKLLLGTKSKEWEYEDEYRYIKKNNEGGSGLHSFPCSKIQEIIIGPFMEIAEKEFILSIAREHLPDTRCYTSKISDTEYSVVKDEQIT